MNILDKICKELHELSKDPRNIKDYSKFHKDGKQHIGIASPLVKKVSSKYFKEIKNLDKKKIFILCEKLLNTRGSGYKDIVFDWAFRIRKRYKKEDFKIFENWLKKYVDTWGSCDDLCTHALGEFIYQFPEFISKIKGWAESKNKWLRRASAVGLIYSIRRKRGLTDVFEIADLLLKDKEDLVQKGYGWMLKETSNKYPEEVFAYVMKNKKEMSRTALRYAIEKMPAKLRQRALK